MDRYLTIPRTSGDVGVMLDYKEGLKQAHNRTMFIKVMKTIRFLICQGSALRGSWNHATNEENCNFLELLKFSCEGRHDPDIDQWLQLKYNKFTSPEIQNEVIKLFALETVRKVIARIKESECNFFSILADESSDVSRKEQLVICIRWVDSNLECHEDFLAITPIQKATAKDISVTILDFLTTAGLDIQLCRGQCYDGASVMRGQKNGVATIIKDINSKCMYIHCHGHSLNLACGDTLKEVDEMKEALACSREIINVIRRSPKKSTKLRQLREETNNPYSGLHNVCPTRWTVRGKAMSSIINNFKELIDVLNQTSLISDDFEMKVKVSGLTHNMKKFKFLFGCVLGENILRQLDQLSQSLQNPNLSALEGYNMACLVVETLQKDRTDEAFNLFYDLVQSRKDELGVDSPKPARKKMRPVKITDYGNADTAHHPSEPKEHYKRVYFQAHDAAINTIKGRFDQPDLKVYIAMVFNPLNFNILGFSKDV